MGLAAGMGFMAPDPAAPTFPALSSCPVPRCSGDTALPASCHPEPSRTSAVKGGHGARFQLGGEVATETDTVDFYKPSW